MQLSEFCKNFPYTNVMIPPHHSLCNHQDFIITFLMQLSGFQINIFLNKYHYSTSLFLMQLSGFHHNFPYSIIRFNEIFYMQLSGFHQSFSYTIVRILTYRFLCKYQDSIITFSMHLSGFRLFSLYNFQNSSKTFCMQ